MNCSGASKSFFSKLEQIEEVNFYTSIYTACSGVKSGTAHLEKDWTAENSEELLLNVVKVIISHDAGIVNGFGGVFHSDSRIPYDNYCFDIQNKVFAFVLLAEHPCIGSMQWNEAVYGCRVVGRKLFVSCLEHGYGVSNPEEVRCNNSHYRFLSKGLQNGIFHFVVKKRDFTARKAEDQRKIIDFTKTSDLRNIGKSSGAE